MRESPFSPLQKAFEDVTNSAKVGHGVLERTGEELERMRNRRMGPRWSIELPKVRGIFQKTSSRRKFMMFTTVFVSFSKFL